MKHLLVVVALAAATLTAADATGTWTGTLTPADGQPGPAHLVLKQEGDRLTGTAGPDASEQHPIQNGRVKDGTLTFELQTGDTLMTVTLAQQGDEMTGSAARVRDDRTQTATLSLKRAK